MTYACIRRARAPRGRRMRWTLSTPNRTTSMMPQFSPKRRLDAWGPKLPASLKIRDRQSICTKPCQFSNERHGEAIFGPWLLRQSGLTPWHAGLRQSYRGRIQSHTLVRGRKPLETSWHISTVAEYSSGISLLAERHTSCTFSWSDGLVSRPI